MCARAVMSNALEEDGLDATITCHALAAGVPRQEGIASRCKQATPVTCRPCKQTHFLNQLAAYSLVTLAVVCAALIYVLYQYFV